MESDLEAYSSDATVQYELSDDGIATTNQSLKCPQEGCNRTFKKRSRLLDHVLSHQGIRQYKCTNEGCLKSYTQNAHLRRHIASVHTDSTSTFRCQFPDCERVYASKAALKKHMDRSHNRTGIYKCTVEGCAESFVKKFQLRHHLYEHQGTLAFQCPVENCKKTFHQTGHLKRHMKTHEGYTCSVKDCGEKFQNWTLLRKHIATNHKRTHKCDKCDKVCSTKSLLRRHMNVNHPISDVGVRLNKCSYSDCTRSYPDMFNLKNHIRIYHKQQLFACQSAGCTKTFSSKQKLSVHETTHSSDVTSFTSANCMRKKRTNEHRKKSLAEKLCRITDSKRSNNATKCRGNAMKSEMVSTVNDAVNATAKLDINKQENSCGIDGNGNSAAQENVEDIVANANMCVDSSKSV